MKAIAMLLLLLLTGCGSASSVEDRLPAWVTDSRVVQFSITPDVVTCDDREYYAADMELDPSDPENGGVLLTCVWTCAEHHGEIGRWELKVPVDAGYHWREDMAEMHRSGCI